jgi:hypothetical protein
MFLEQIATRRARLALNNLTPHKAKIINLSSKKTFLNNSIKVSFNPQSITYTTCPEYESVSVPDAPGGVRSNYAGAKPAKLSMKLLFDTTMTGDDVRDKYIDFLVELTVPIKDKPTAPKAPPLCKFIWGDFSQEPYLSFKSVVKELSVEYIWFLPNGQPVRAGVDITFQPPDELQEGTNPTSRSEARSVWRVIEGQTLDWIAYQEYGDSAAWRHIAQVNNLRNPRDLRPGMVLKLVPLP